MYNIKQKNRRCRYARSTSNNFILNKLFLTGSLSLALIALVTIFTPTVLTPTKAATYPHGPVPTTSISLTSASSSTGLTMSVTPGSNGAITTASDTVAADTTTVTGYNLTLSTDSSTNNSLTHTSLPGHTISPQTTNNTPLATNTWGYSLTNPNTPGTPVTTNFNSVPTSASPTTITSTNAPTNDGTVSNPISTDVYYGANLNLGTPSGIYQATIVYTATSNSVPAPTATGISPSTGSTSGGTVITITGTNLDATTAVTVGGQACSNISVLSNTQISCTTPAGTAGAQNVIVTTQGGSATRSFTYQNPAPTVTSICRVGETCRSDNTSSGHFRGGETFTITGANFTGATAVKLGTASCRNFTVDSDTQITCLSMGSSDNGASATFTVSVNVTTAQGTNTTNTLFTYRYPNSSFTGQGTYLHILGTDIANGSKVSVGGTNCANQTIVDGTHITCTSPSLSAGTGKALSIAAPTASQGNMQNWSGCSAIATPAYTTTDWAPYTRVLTDTRDGKTYRVRKLPDGKCWMIDNMKLGGTGSDITLTPANSNVTSNFVLPGNAIYNSATKLSNGRCDASSLTNTAGTAMTCNGTTTVNAPATNTSKTDQPDDNLRFAGYADPSNSANSSMLHNCRPGAPGLSAESLSGCGYLYNWYTATAGVGNYTWPADTTANANAVPSDICPAGWHLPKAGNGTTTGNEFATLNGAMLNGGAASTTSNATTIANWTANGPFSGAYSGYWGVGFSAQGGYGYYWSSSAYSATNARYLLFYYANARPGNGDYGKYYGNAVRCLL